MRKAQGGRGWGLASSVLVCGLRTRGIWEKWKGQDLPILACCLTDALHNLYHRVDVLLFIERRKGMLIE